MTRYLLVLRERNDKSKFITQAGFTLENPNLLDAALRELIDSNEAIADRTDAYGTYYQVKGTLRGINGVNLDIARVWLHRKIDLKF